MKNVHRDIDYIERGQAWEVDGLVLIETTRGKSVVSTISLSSFSHSLYKQ